MKTKLLEFKRGEAGELVRVENLVATAIFNSAKEFAAAKYKEATTSGKSWRVSVVGLLFESANLESKSTF